MVKIESPLQQIVDRLRELFLGRASANGLAGSEHLLPLRCRIIRDASRFAQVLKETEFTGPVLHINPQVKATYSIHPKCTRFCVDYTALLELNQDQPAEAIVYLDPSSYPDEGQFSMLQKGVNPEPEAFFYPLCVEWVRSFESCLMHCGAIALDGRAMVFTGPPGSGKSTHVLRSVLRGAGFLADDLGLLSRKNNELVMRPFREMANVGQQTMDLFPELAKFRNCPIRGEGKYCVSIPERLGVRAVGTAAPGWMVHITPDDSSHFRRHAIDLRWEGIPHMAWFLTRPDESRNHFKLLLDWLDSCEPVEVSRGYLREHLDDFLDVFRSQPNV